MKAKHNQADLLANRPWPFSSQNTNPLAWWRTLPSDKLRDAEKLLLHATLERIEVLRGGAEFRAALRGDTAAAIATAFSVTPIQDFTLEVDIAMTALLRCAADGDSAAALVLANVLGRTDLGHPHATVLSASWYVEHVHRSPHQRSFSTEETSLLDALNERYVENEAESCA